MATSKILYISEGKGFRGKHLKAAIEYISNPEKTDDGRWIGAVNCFYDKAYESMIATKRRFDKVDKRQGYHLVISFKQGEIDADTAFEIVGRFADEYLGTDYEALYSVHNDTEHIHGHIICAPIRGESKSA